VWRWATRGNGAAKSSTGDELAESILFSLGAVCASGSEEPELAVPMRSRDGACSRSAFDREYGFSLPLCEEGRVTKMRGNCAAGNGTAVTEPGTSASRRDVENEVGGMVAGGRRRSGALRDRNEAGLKGRRYKAVGMTTEK
jgi:hypothetical protein